MNSGYLTPIQKRTARKIYALAKSYRSLSNDKLRLHTKQFREKLKKGYSMNKLLPEAFATICEADRRVLGMFPYPVQIVGAIALHNGNLAEMKTGEGKTLTETMPVYLNALTGKGVHVVTVNEYLSKRDATAMGKVFKFLGLTVGCNSKSLSRNEKRIAYKSDILYSTNDELAFDYLKDNMVMSLHEKVQGKLHYAIIDEIDSILIDEAKTPLIISGQAKSYEQLYKSANEFVKNLTKDDYSFDIETKHASLTHQGIVKANQFFGLNSLYDEDSIVMVHYIVEALKAHIVMKKDVDYVVSEGQIALIDQFTGRLMPARRFADGLHQAIEAKEGVPIHQVNQVDASITYQNFFKMYEKIAGMTGTARNEAKEFYENYKMKVKVIPTNKPSKRIDLPLRLYVTKQAKLRAILNLVSRIHKRGQPILLGTTSVENSEELHKMLTLRGLRHQVLNAKNDMHEAQIIASAGEKGAITVATNMAGRGTDIKLGQGVGKLGGLFVIGTEKHVSRRIDDQLKGRAGRQGDPGYSQFFASLEDDLMVRFADDHIKHMREVLISKGMANKPIKDRIAKKWVLTVQKRVEGSNYDERAQTLLLDNVMAKERNTVYGQRNLLLQASENNKLTPYLTAVFETSINRNVDLYRSKRYKKHPERLRYFIANNIGATVNMGRLKQTSNRQLKRSLISFAAKQLEEKERVLDNRKQIAEFERVVMLQEIDAAWKANINEMEQLKLSIMLQSYGQHNPVVEYENMAQNLFTIMSHRIQDNITKKVLLAEILSE